MAQTQLVVKNTFLDVADHKEPCDSQMRCHSVPPTWKPIAPLNRSMKSSPAMPNTSSTPSVSSDSRARSVSDSGPDGSSTTAVCDAEDITAAPFTEFNCAAPTSDVDDGCAPSFCRMMSAPAMSVMSNEVGCLGVADALKSDSGDAPTEEDLSDCVPEQGNATLDAVTKAIYMALLTSGQTEHVRVEPCVAGASPTLIVAEMLSGPRISSRCYDAVHVARRALEAITTNSENVSLLSKRVQKEDRGYSLRSSIACIPKGAEDRICWDFFHKGQCPRRRNCTWYHPQESDVFRVKVSALRRYESPIGSNPRTCFGRAPF